MAKHIVATVDEIPPGERKIVEVAGRSIGVFNLGGEGVLSGFVQARVPGEYSYVRRGEILRCPWHAWEFDVRTGQSWFDPAKTRVRTYDVTVEPGGDESTSSNELSEAGLEWGPFTAETYSVSVNKQNVVLEL